MLPFTAVHHMAVIASSLEKARAFYVDALGFKVLRENFRPAQGDCKLDLQLGDMELEIFIKPDAPKRPILSRSIGFETPGLSGSGRRGCRACPGGTGNCL